MFIFSINASLRACSLTVIFKDFKRDFQEIHLKSRFAEHVSVVVRKKFGEAVTSSVGFVTKNRKSIDWIPFD